MNSISTKLFLTLLGLTAIILVTTVSLARWSFEYGFLDYRRSLEVERLQNMASSLLSHYESNDEQWGESIERVYDQVFRRSLPLRFEGPGGFKRRPPPPRPPFNVEHGDNFGSRFERDPNRRPRPVRPEHQSALFDSENRHLAGSQLDYDRGDIVSMPINYKGDRIGFLKTVVPTAAITPEEKAFSRQQAWASLVIALLAFALAAMASWLLSRTLLTPIFSLKRGVKLLAKGNYGRKLESRSKDELGELTSDINRLSVILENNRNARRRWLADISHELRTPVTILTGEIDAMKDGVRKIDRQGVDSLGHEAERISHLIDDLYQLSLSDVGGLSYHFDSIDVAELLSSTIQPFIARAKAKQLELISKVNGRYLAIGDVNRLEQLFINLLTNSINYTDSPGVIEVDMFQDKEYLIINFDDSSPSVLVSDLDLLFEPLYREEQSRNRSSGGAGLGLAISKSIVEAHQGQIIAGLSSLGGVQMQIRLPIK